MIYQKTVIFNDNIDRDIFQVFMGILYKPHWIEADVRLFIYRIEI
jgi:hypothetical protein